MTISSGRRHFETKSSVMFRYNNLLMQQNYGDRLGKDEYKVFDVFDHCFQVLLD